jgi:1,2-diacylglycerol 3-alpha-glucosyltransferase
MNIAIFTNNYLPNPYGVATSIESFRKQFEKKGHTVFIFAPENDDYEDENPNVFRYPSLDIKYRIKFPIPIPYSSQIDKKIEELNIDIIHSQHPNLLGDAALRWAKKKNIPLVFTWHTLYNKYTHYIPLIPEGISSKLAIKNAVEYANKANKIIIPTASIKKIIEKWGVKNKEIIDIPTGVEMSCFENADGEKIRNKLGVTKDQKLIMSISRFTEEKNVMFLLQAIIKVLKSDLNTVFVFGGEGYLKEEMQEVVEKEKLNNRIIFTGIIKKDDIKNYFQAADIFVYASKSETQGTIITEAMCSALPIVAVDATGVQSLIDNKKTGILIPENEDKFAKAIIGLIGDDKLAETLSKNAKLVANEKYTSEICANEMLKAYKETIETFNNKKFSN